MTDELTVERWGLGYAVFRGKDRVRGPFGSRDMALTALRLAEHQARLTPRACLCCGDTFASEGPHNRMCNACRRQTEGFVGGLVTTQRTPIRRARQ